MVVRHIVSGGGVAMPVGLSVLRLYLLAATILVIVRVVQLAVGS